MARDKSETPWDSKIVEVQFITTFKKLRGSPLFPLAFTIFWYAGLLLLPMTFNGLQPYRDFVLNAYLWLLLGIAFRLASLALSAQYAAAAQNSAACAPRMC